MESIAKEISNVCSALNYYRNFYLDPVLRNLAERREKFLLDIASAQLTSLPDLEEIDRLADIALDVLSLKRV